MERGPRLGLTRLGLPLQGGAAFSIPESVKEMEIPESDVSPNAREKLQPLLGQCLQLGFHSPRYYMHESLRKDVRTYFISMLHRSGEFTLRLMHTRAENGPVIIENLLAVLLSELNDGTFFFTSDQAEKMKVPPGILNNRLIGGSPLQLIESHQQKLAQFNLRNPARPVLSTDVLDDVWNRYENLSRDFQMARGLYIRLTPEEVEGQQKLTDTAQAMTSEGVRHADVLVELSHLQNKKAGWGSAIWIFLVSMLLFVGAGTQSWSWTYLLILVPVLFFHELGHYVTMRAFNYRNLRMFFIPFFGAAVAGQHYNVPGWKKVIVSMMGPVPGIVVGVIIGGAGLMLNQPLLIKIALVTLILNGINLLPVLPLDGGWVFHNLLFSRHHMLDAAFRVVAALALIAGGMFSKDKILMFLGIPMLLGIPTAYRMARITRTLRDRGVSASSADNETVPPETAAAIIDELKKDLPKSHTNKLVAQQTLQIFENLNARPPGWLATGVLLFAYFASLGMAFVFAGVLIVGRRGNVEDLYSTFSNQARTPLVCGSTLSWANSGPAQNSTSPPVTIVASFPSRGKAENAFEGLTNRLPPSTSAKAFGNCVFLAVPNAEPELRKQWFAELQSLTKTVFVESTNTPTTFSISCQFSTAKQAEETRDELNEYLSANANWLLVPPWLPEDPRNAGERAAHRLARRSFLKAQSAQRPDFTDAKMRALEKQIGEAQRQGDDAEAAALGKQMNKLSTELARERLEKLKRDNNETVDPVMVDLYGAWLRSIVATNREGDAQVMREMAQRMGRLGTDNRFSLRSGYVMSKEQKIHLNWASFTKIPDGAPALLNWLCAKGATDLKYDMNTGSSRALDEE